MRNIKALFIDIDNTITRVKPDAALPPAVAERSLLFVLEEAAVKFAGLSPEEAAARMKRVQDDVPWWHWSDFIVQLGLNASEFWQYAREREHAYIEPTGAEIGSALRSLKQAGYLLYIASNNPTSGILHKLSLAGLASIHGTDLFHQLLGCTELRAMKRDIAFWEKALAHTGLRAAEIATIGDNPYDDCAVPQSIGIAHSFLINREQDCHREDTERITHVMNFDQIVEALRAGRASHLGGRAMLPQANKAGTLAPTYCNPLPLPDYPRGRCSLDKKNSDYGWLHPVRRDFREMADPSVIFHEGCWYLYPSCGMLWRSMDFVNWEFIPIAPSDIGYAPTVTKHGSVFLMTACCNEMWTAPHPEGPWVRLGKIRDENENVFHWNDPMLFSDTDGSLYCYHGLGADGIYVVRMRRDDPTRFDGPRLHCFAFYPGHKWERFGEHNQDATKSFTEGAWINKIGDTYYLQYSAPGTEWKGYAIGCYKSRSPLGPWEYQQRNPILIHRGGLINGCGHGCIVEGPLGTLWCFYTISVRIEHNFERRIGMDPAAIDINGDLFVAGPSETPQWAPGVMHEPAKNANDAGLDIVSANCLATASSSAPGRDPCYACDENIRTWWEAAEAAPQWLSLYLGNAYSVTAVRILFGDRNLDYAGGILPGAYRYRVEGSLDGGQWTTLIDRSDNHCDQHIAYHVCANIQVVSQLRLVVLSAPAGMSISVWEFTAFGTRKTANNAQ